MHFILAGRYSKTRIKETRIIAISRFIAMKKFQNLICFDSDIINFRIKAITKNLPLTGFYCNIGKNFWGIRAIRVRGRVAQFLVWSTPKKWHFLGLIINFLGLKPRNPRKPKKFIIRPKKCHFLGLSWVRKLSNSTASKGSSNMDKHLGNQKSGLKRKANASQTQVRPKSKPSQPKI